MATIVASRYAVLSLDDDDSDDKLYSSKKKKNTNKKPVVPNVQNQVQQKSESNNKQKKKKVETIQAQNQKKPNKTSSNIVPLNKKKKEPESNQWEEWKEKDNQYVEENFEEELSKAILLSKLDYEKKKDFYNSVKISSAEGKKKNEGKKDKKNKKVMSLSEFNGLDSKPKDSGTSSKVTKPQKENVKSEFFNQLDDDIKKEITKEHLLSKKKVTDPVKEALTLVLYEASIEEKNREIAELKEENERLNILLKNVKTRNTKLCQIIGNGEMKDKAEVLMEVERLQVIKDELSSEVANLHVQLEQERSKVRQLLAEGKNKDKGKKHFHDSSRLYKVLDEEQ